MRPHGCRTGRRCGTRSRRQETRKNSQVAREIRVALPAELDHGRRVELVREFCQREFVARGMVADIALHAPGRTGDDRNHHAHILLTTREIGPEGFGAKNRDWNAVEMLEGWREAWARDNNRALERCGHEERIDHRTLEAQRIEAQERACLMTSLGFLAIREPLPGTPNMPGSGGGRIENGSAVAGRAVV